MARKAVISTAVLDLMEQRGHHAWTLEDLHAELTARGVAADFSTVFRAAEKLAGAGRVTKLVLDGGRARYELASAHHDHLLCTRCDELIAVPCLIADKAFAELEAATGIVVAEHRVMLSGLCPTCRTAEPSPP